MRSTQMTVGSFTFDVVTAGPDGGELVLLLHGFPQTASAWDGVMRPLVEAGYRVLAPNQRGYSPGARPGRTADYRLEDVAGDAVGLVDAIGRGRFHVVGHDWGGVVAWHLGATRPERLLSLTSLATPHPAAYLRKALTTSQLLRSAYVPLFRTPVVAEAVLGAGGGRLLRTALERSGLDHEHAAAYTAAVRGPGALTTALRWYRAARPTALATLGDVDVPTLHVWGADDGALGPEATRATARHVTGHYELVELRASHWLPETRAPEVAAELVRFLDSPAVRRRADASVASR